MKIRDEFTLRWVTSSNAMIGSMITLLITGLIVIVIGLSMLGTVGVQTQGTTEQDRYGCYRAEENAAPPPLLTDYVGVICTRGTGTTFENAGAVGRQFIPTGIQAPAPRRLHGTVTGVGTLPNTNPFVTTVASNIAPLDIVDGNQVIVWIPDTDEQTRGLTALLPLLFIIILIMAMVGGYSYLSNRTT